MSNVTNKIMTDCSSRPGRAASPAPGATHTTQTQNTQSPLSWRPVTRVFRRVARAVEEVGEQRVECNGGRRCRRTPGCGTPRSSRDATLAGVSRARKSQRCSQQTALTESRWEARACGAAADPSTSPSCCWCRQYPHRTQMTSSSDAFTGRLKGRRVTTSAGVRQTERTITAAK